MSRQHRVHNPFDAIAFTRSRMLPGHNEMFRTLSHWPVKKMRNLIAATFLAMPPKETEIALQPYGLISVMVIKRILLLSSIARHASNIPCLQLPLTKLATSWSQTGQASIGSQVLTPLGFKPYAMHRLPIRRRDMESIRTRFCVKTLLYLGNG